MLKKYGFEKEERLSGLKTINHLFNSGNTITLYPLKIYWIEVNDNFKYPARVLFDASKKIIKKASERNLITRKIREAYRLKKHLLYDGLKSLNKSIALAYIYTGAEIISIKEIETKLMSSFNAILEGFK